MGILAGSLQVTDIELRGPSAMSWTMRADEGGSYEQPPTGPQAAVLTQIVDIGTHTDTSTTYGTQRRHQVIFRWEMAETMTSGEPYTIQKFYTLSMHEKANLRRDLESWRGKALDANETIEIDAVLGKPCLLNVTESETGKSKIASISRLPKGMDAPTPRGPLLLWRMDEPEWSVFEQLSEFTRGKIEKSEEYPGLTTHGQQAEQRTAAAEPTNVGPADDFDDDIPF